MILGRWTATYSLPHVFISLVGVGSGLLVLWGLIANKRLEPAGELG